MRYFHRTMAFHGQAQGESEAWRAESTDPPRQKHRHHRRRACGARGHHLWPLDVRKHRLQRARPDRHRFHVVEFTTEASRARRGECRPLHVRMRNGIGAVRRDRYDMSGPQRQHYKNSWNGSEGAELWRRILKKFFACMAVAVFAVACNSDGGGGSPTDPSQVNVEFSTTDLVVGNGAEAVPGNRATLNFELWLYNAAGTASKGTRIQGSFDQNPQVPGTLIGPITFVIGDRTLIAGFDQGVRGMRLGGKRRMYIPPSLAWGSQGSGSQIPPNASVVFEVELITLVQ